jgi:hypothetical protein
MLQNLKDFVPSCQGLVAAGCFAPVDIGALRAFANFDHANPAPTSSDDFYKGSDLNDRLRFFSSALCKDFIDCRMVALLREAKWTEIPDERKNMFASLRQLCAAQSEDPSSLSEIQKEAMWAPLLVGDGAPEDRVRFAFEDEKMVAHRIAPSASFVCHDGSAKRTALLGFVDPKALKTNVSVRQFVDTLDFMNDAGLRKLVTNPVVGCILDFRADLLGPFAGGALASAAGAPEMGGRTVPAWATKLTAIVPKTNMEVAWWKDVPDSFDSRSATRSRLH